MASTINASTSAGLVSTADTSGVLQLQTAGTTAVSIDASQAVTFSAGTANGVSYLNGSKVLTTGSALTFDSSDRLIVGAGSAAIGNRMEVTTTSAGQSIGIRGRASDAIGILSWHANASPTEYARISSDNTSALIFGTGSSGTEGMRLTSTGLGIGTSSPGAKLDIIGSSTALLSNQTSAYAPSFNSAATSVKLVNDSSTTGAYTSLEFWARNASSNINIAYIASPSTSTDDSGTLVFGRRTGVSTSIESARIDSSGNLGIGTTANASAILDAQSTTKGVRMPNMTTTQKNAIASPAAGLMVFDTTLAKLCVYSGSAWQTITSV
jgi:hypothetical protein